MKNNFESSIVEVGDEKVLYVTLPYKGCTAIPRCLFCGVQEQVNRAIEIDECYGDLVTSGVEEALDGADADTLVLYNGGNIIRSDEMWLPALMEDIPALVEKSERCEVLEIEVRADDCT